MMFERITGVKETRHTNWGPVHTAPATSSRRPQIAGLGIFTPGNRKSIIGVPGEWSGRLRLGLQPTLHPQQQLQQPARSSASSTRSTRPRPAVYHYYDDTTGEDTRDDELRRMRKSLEELTRKVDAILEHHGTA